MDNIGFLFFAILVGVTLGVLMLRYSSEVVEDLSNPLSFFLLSETAVQYFQPEKVSRPILRYSEETGKYENWYTCSMRHNKFMSDAQILIDVGNIYGPVGIRVWPIKQTNIKKIDVDLEPFYKTNLFEATDTLREEELCEIIAFLGEDNQMDPLELFDHLAAHYR